MNSPTDTRINPLLRRQRIDTLPFGLGILLIALVLLVGYSCVDHIQSNLVWLKVTNVVAQQEQQEGTYPVSGIASPVANAIDSDYETLRVGAGILAAASGQEAAALAYWTNISGRFQQQLIVLGRLSQRHGNDDLAMLYYRGAGALKDLPGWYQIGQLCQLRLADLSQLRQDNRVRCEELFAEIDNLLLNGDFSSATLGGWERTAGYSTLDTSLGMPAPAMTVIGRSGEPGRGSYQSITLPPGTHVRFSANFYNRNADPESLRPLYIGFRRLNGESAGNHIGANVSLPQGEWHSLTRDYVAPASEGGRFQFAPVLLDGAGEVDVDNVSLEIMSWPDATILAGEQQ